MSDHWGSLDEALKPVIELMEPEGVTLDSDSRIIAMSAYNAGMATAIDARKDAAMLRLRAESAEKALNRIQDFFEYRYESLAAEEIKVRVMTCIEQHAAEISTKE